MITSRKSRKTGNTVLMFDFQPEFSVYQALIELTLDGKSKIIPFKCTGRDGQRFMKDIELESASSPVTISYIITTTLTGKSMKVKDSKTNLRVISETDDSITLFPKREKGVKAQYFKCLKNTLRKPKMSSEEEEKLVKEYEQVILNNPELMQAIEILAQGSSENEEDTGDSDTLDPLNLARQIDDNASDEEISKKLFNLIFNEKSEEDKIAECLEKIEELGSICISDTSNIEKHFEKFKQYIFNNTKLLGKMSPENYDYVRKLIRSIKSLMSACKKITSKKSRSEALRKYCDKTELDDNVQSLQNITKKISANSESVSNVSNVSDSEDNSKNSEIIQNNSERVSNNSETSLKNSERVSEVSKNVESNSESVSDSAENFNYVQSISTNLTENIAGFT